MAIVFEHQERRRRAVTTANKKLEINQFFLATHFAESLLVPAILPMSRWRGVAGPRTSSVRSTAH